MVKDTAQLTPLMKQYWEVKSLHDDKILLFRMGDFFEMFYDDAVKAAPILGIALTQRNKKSLDETPMCGMPHHSIGGHINKLLSHGLKVAICDQVEDPKFAKGIVKRAVTRILTPGMVFDSDTLESTQSNYLASLDQNSLALVDTSTGEAFYYRSQYQAELESFLYLLPVAEIVISSDFKLSDKINEQFLVSKYDVLDKDFPFHLDKNSPTSVKRILNYIDFLSGESLLKIISAFSEKKIQGRMKISSTVLRHLEIFQSYKGEKNGSFFNSINKCQTSAGARKLRSWISFPLKDLESILARQEKVTFWRAHLLELKQIRQSLSQMGDIERRLGRIAQPQSNGRDLLSLSQSLKYGLEVLRRVDDFQLFHSEFDLNPVQQLVNKIDSMIVEDPPLSVKQGYLIQKGYSVELDELIELSTNSQALLLKMEQEEKERTGINSLKIRYNNVFGYYIEITNTHKDKIPVHYQRKQTLANAERYCTEELIELEKKVLSAQAKRSELEFEYFDQLKSEILSLGSVLLTLAAELSEIDVVTGLSWLSLEENYCLPQISHNRSLNIHSSRHPVVEQSLRGQFVANDIKLNSGECLLLTGPNMAGKSTLMRQVALISILTQIGSYVPALRAEVPLFDALFTRIGASDQLTEGLSTFMVEMTETAQMIKDCTEESLVILDEVGRGTATFDGMCLAQAILENLVIDKKALTFFATHYHELTKMELDILQIKNAHMSVAEKNGEIKFLHSLTSGPALKSYGIQVAELAGVPKVITHRAKRILKEIESHQDHNPSAQMSFMGLHTQADSHLEFETSQELLNELKKYKTEEEDLKIQLNQLKNLVQKLQSFSTLNSTPLDALNFISEMQKELKS